MFTQVQKLRIARHAARYARNGSDRGSLPTASHFLVIRFLKDWDSHRFQDHSKYMSYSQVYG